jgi:outer membrane protein assembly factor BamA
MANCSRSLTARDLALQNQANLLENRAALSLQRGFAPGRMKPQLTIFEFLQTVLCCIFALSLTSTSAVWAQEKISLKDVRITGNVRVEEDGIRLHIKSRAGVDFDPALVEQDVKAIFRMGFFDDVEAQLSPENVLVYSVKEKP